MKLAIPSRKPPKNIIRLCTSKTQLKEIIFFLNSIVSLQNLAEAKPPGQSVNGGITKLWTGFKRLSCVGPGKHRFAHFYWCQHLWLLPSCPRLGLKNGLGASILAEWEYRKSSPMTALNGSLPPWQLSRAKG